LENIATTTVVVGIDQNLEVIIQILADVTAQFGGNDTRGFGVIAMNPKKDGISDVEDAYFCLFCCRFTFVGLPLPKIGDWFG
jgi:hypothetical protein